MYSPFFSPDGQWVGFFSLSEIKKIAVSGGPAITVCEFSGVPRGASWGDGNTITFAVNGPAGGLWRVSADGGKAERLLPADSGTGYAFPSVLPGGRAVLFTIERADAGRYEPIAPSSRPRWGSTMTRDGKGLFAFDMSPQKTNRVLLLPFTSPAQSQSPDKVLFEGNFSDISPDGRYIAYQSFETGSMEIYVRAFPDVHNGPWQISTAGGAHAVWSRDGRELFFKDAANALQVVRVDTSGPRLVSGPPVKVFDTPYFEPNPQRWYDVSPDGRRFLMIKENTTARRSVTPASMVVVQNWADELKTRLAR